MHILEKYTEFYEGGFSACSIFHGEYFLKRGKCPGEILHGGEGEKEIPSHDLKQGQKLNKKTILLLKIRSNIKT